MEQRLLIVDDETGIRDILKEYAEAEGFTVVEAEDGKQAIALAQQGEYTAIILDVMMPEVDGWTVLREVRRTSEVPVLMLSARGEEYDRLFGFELGADDYIVKPFSPREVLARIRAIGRRAPSAKEDEIERIRMGSLVVEPDSRSCWVAGQAVSLTPKEYDLLLAFVRNPGRVMTREQLLERVWGYEYYGDARTVDTHVKQLRERLGSSRNAIVTVWGTGYKFQPEANA